MRRFLFGSARPPGWARRFSSFRKPPEPGQQRPYFDLSKYKTVWGKAKASLRFSLNRFQPWSADHRLAIASWMVGRRGASFFRRFSSFSSLSPDQAIGTTWWVVAGTSTFLSVVIFVLPSDPRIQECPVNTPCTSADHLCSLLCRGSVDRN